YKGFLLALALSAITTAALAQNNDQDGQDMSNPPMQSQPAPIERGGYNSNGYNNDTVVQKLMPGQMLAPERGTISTIAAPGVFIRVGRRGALRAVKLTDEDTELSLVRGVINVSVHNSVKHAQILIDLPGGQTNLIKDGFYTFNANTNTVRVLKGEAYAYPGHNIQQKPIKIKENHAVVFSGPDIRSFEFDPFEARMDLIPYGRMGGQSPGPGYYGPYAGYPYYDYGYPYYYGYGYPGFYDPFYMGFGYYGGWGGGWRGGGGWHGGGGGWHGGGGGHGGGGHH
ncbi:MAG: hypothetical protein WB439_08225, partial [Acidobacteriaceae bacterium]